MRKVTGKQMKTVWRAGEFGNQESRKENSNEESIPDFLSSKLESIWTLSAPGSDEKQFRKHSTQKPMALIERCLPAGAHEGENFTVSLPFFSFPGTPPGR